MARSVDRSCNALISREDVDGSPVGWFCRGRFRGFCVFARSVLRACASAPLCKIRMSAAFVADRCMNTISFAWSDLLEATDNDSWA